VEPGDRVTVTCVDLDDDGAGVTTPGGDRAARLHVAGALPDERVVAIVEHRSAHGPDAWARLTTIETPSPARRLPACRAFGACGGCVLQHLDYGAQLAWKRARVARALAGLDVAIADCVASPRPLGYRNRSKLVPARIAWGAGELCSPRTIAGGVGNPSRVPMKNERLVLGAYAPRSHDVVDLAGCRIAEPPLDDTAAALAAQLDQAGVAPYDERTLTGQLRHVVLRASHDGRVLATWVVTRPLADGPALARAFRSARPEVIGVVEHVNRGRGNAIFAADADNERTLDGEATIDDRVDVGGDAVRLRLSSGAFFQANRDVAGLAYAAIVRALAPRPGDRVVDAYCGVGGIALALVRAGATEVIGIETQAGAVADAVASAALNGVTSARFIAGDVARQLATLDRADAVVVNPPRKGCAPEVLTALARLAPRAIAYLSCDPDTLARDLAWLVARGYRIGGVTPFDMLPHTPHVEALALLTRK
jgi:23S rRNA (uracil1939-C5)-methyltransferase